MFGLWLLIISAIVIGGILIGKQAVEWLDDRKASSLHRKRRK